MYLHDAIERADDAGALEIALDVGDVGVHAKRDVVHLVGYIEVLGFLVKGSEEERVAVGGQMEVPGNFVDFHEASYTAALAAVDALAESINVLVAIA